MAGLVISWNLLQNNIINVIIITARKRSCGKVMFLHVSICSRGGVVGSAKPPLGPNLLPPTHEEHGSHQTRGAIIPPPPITSKVDGMHPTGMLSCFDNIFEVKAKYNVHENISVTELVMIPQIVFGVKNILSRLGNVTSTSPQYILIPTVNITFTGDNFAEYFI